MSKIAINTFMTTGVVKVGAVSSFLQRKLDHVRRTRKQAENELWFLERKDLDELSLHAQMDRLCVLPHVIARLRLREETVEGLCDQWIEYMTNEAQKHEKEEP